MAPPGLAILPSAEDAFVFAFLFFFFSGGGIGLDDGCVLRPIAVIIVPTNGMFQQTDVSFLFRVPAWTGMWENGSRLSWATVESVLCCYVFSAVCFAPGVLYPTYVLCRGTEGNMFRFEDECGLPAKKQTSLERNTVALRSSRAF